MKRTLTLILALVLALVMLASCGQGKATDISEAKSVADLAGAKIAAQAGTFHADALFQIKDVKSSTYPEFADLLTAVKSGADKLIRIGIVDSHTAHCHRRSAD